MKKVKKKPGNIKKNKQDHIALGFEETVKRLLNPLAWFLGICASASIASFRLQAPRWLGIMFGVFAGIGALFYLVSYAYFVLTNKEDCLRSERFSIQKMAIQRGFVGDDMTGFFKLPEKPLELPSKSEQREDK